MVKPVTKAKYRPCPMPHPSINPTMPPSKAFSSRRMERTGQTIARPATKNRHQSQAVTSDVSLGMRLPRAPLALRVEPSARYPMAGRGGRPSAAGQQLARCLAVGGDLRLELVEAAELHLRPDELDQRHAQHLAVEVARVIEQVDLEV